MTNVLNKLITKREDGREVVDVINEGDLDILLPQTNDYLDMENQYRHVFL